MSKYINEFPQHFISPGVPAAFYKVYFGEPNQDPKANPKAPFSDAARTVAISPTQTLDATGRYTQEIFLDGGYSLQIDDTDGVLWDEDAEIYGANFSLEAIQYIDDFGEVGTSDDRATFQAAIDYSSTNGVAVHIQPGTYIIGGSGSTIESQEYGLLLKTGCQLIGCGSHSVTIKVKDSANIDLFNSNRVGGLTDVTLSGFTMDGNEANQSAAAVPGFNLWAFGIDGLRLFDLYSLNPKSWGFRIQQCNNVIYDQLRCNHSAETNSDGIHFLDTDNVVGGTALIYTEGDDGFIIGTQDHAVVENYAISSVVVECPPSAVGAANRGIALLQGTAASLATTIQNINIASSVCHNCDGVAVALTGASYRNVHVNNVSQQCQTGLYLIPGDATYPGTLENCSFTIVASDTDGEGIQMVDTNGTFENNSINARIRNPADTFLGVYVRGDNWTGSIDVDYDPAGTKATPNNGIIVEGDKNRLSLSCKDADKNIQMKAACNNNTIYLGDLDGAITADIETLVTSTNTKFIGGRVTGTVTDSGTETEFTSVIGATIRKQISLNFTTEADGTAVWAHGLVGTPSVAFAQLLLPGSGVTLAPIAVDSTNVDFELRDAVGTLVVAGTFNAYVDVSL